MVDSPEKQLPLFLSQSHFPWGIFRTWGREFKYYPTAFKVQRFGELWARNCELNIYSHLNGASLIDQLVKNPPVIQETPVGKIPWRRDRLPTPVLGFPFGSAGKESTCNGRPGFDPWVGKIPWRRERLLTPVFWPGEFHGLSQRDTTARLFTFTHLNDQYMFFP